MKYLGIVGSNNLNMGPEFWKWVIKKAGKFRFMREEGLNPSGEVNDCSATIRFGMQTIEFLCNYESCVLTVALVQTAIDKINKEGIYFLREDALGQDDLGVIVSKKITLANLYDSKSKLGKFSHYPSALKTRVEALAWIWEKEKRQGGVNENS